MMLSLVLSLLSFVLLLLRNLFHPLLLLFSLFVKLKPHPLLTHGVSFFLCLFVCNTAESGEKETKRARVAFFTKKGFQLLLSLILPLFMQTAHNGEIECLCTGRRQTVGKENKRGEGKPEEAAKPSIRRTALMIMTRRKKKASKVVRIRLHTIFLVIISIFGPCC
jgi:hypothetical protein